MSELLTLRLRTPAPLAALNSSIERWKNDIRKLYILSTHQSKHGRRNQEPKYALSQREVGKAEGKEGRQRGKVLGSLVRTGCWNRRIKTFSQPLTRRTEGEKHDA